MTSSHVPGCSRGQCPSALEAEVLRVGSTRVIAPCRSTGRNILHEDVVGLHVSVLDDVLGTRQRKRLPVFFADPRRLQVRA